MLSSRRSTAATGATTPSSAQLRPPNAIIETPTALIPYTTSAPRSRWPAAAAFASEAKTATLAPITSSTLQTSGRSRRRVASYWSSCRRVRLPMNRSIVQSTRPNRRSSFGGRRIDGEAVGVVGVALRGAHLLGVPVLPDRALAQQPVRRQPGAGQDERSPPAIAGQDHGAGQPADHLHQPAGDEVHREPERRPGDAEVEVAGGGQVSGESWVFEVADASGPDARLGQLIVEPGRGALAEAGADRLVERREHLEQHEDDGGERQGDGEIGATLDRADQHAHGDAERGRQHAPQHQHRPPDGGQRGIGLRQHADDLPLVAGEQALRDGREPRTVDGVLTPLDTATASAMGRPLPMCDRWRRPRVRQIEGNVCSTVCRSVYRLSAPAATALRRNCGAIATRLQSPLLCQRSKGLVCGDATAPS